MRCLEKKKKWQSSGDSVVKTTFYFKGDWPLEFSVKSNQQNRSLKMDDQGNTVYSSATFHEDDTQRISFAADEVEGILVRQCALSFECCNSCPSLQQTHVNDKRDKLIKKNRCVGARGVSLKDLTKRPRDYRRGWPNFVSLVDLGSVICCLWSVDYFEW